MVYNLGDHTKAGKNENVHLGMPKKSEEVLVKNGIPPSRRIKEGGVEVAVS